MAKRPSSFRLVPKAREDLEAIWRYSCETWSVDQADAYYERLVAAFEALASGDLIGQSVDELRRGYFRYAVGAHLVFYRYRASELEIVRILHQRMDVALRLRDT